MPDYVRFETRRLILRRPAPGDEADLIALDALPDVTAYLAMRGVDPARLAERIAPRIELSQKEPDAPYGWWVMQDRESGGFHGRALLAPLWAGSEEIELGVYLGAASRHRGYATEAGAALLDHAFFSLKLAHVVGCTARETRAVSRLLRRLHFTHKGKITLYGTDADRYALTAEGWLPRRS
jgi:RimJ/RimL family protein N-acetyltransferase